MVNERLIEIYSLPNSVLAKLYDEIYPTNYDGINTPEHLKVAAMKMQIDRLKGSESVKDYLLIESKLPKEGTHSIHDKARVLTTFQHWLGANYDTLSCSSVEMTERALKYLNENPDYFKIKG